MHPQHASRRALAAHPLVIWASVALGACSQGGELPDVPSVSPTAVLPIVAEPLEEDPMHGMAGNGAGPGVEPPSTPTPEPPDMGRSPEMPPQTTPPPTSGSTDNASGEAPMDEPGGAAAPSTPSAGDCVLATRLDTCCREVIPADDAAIAADPCLVPYDLAGAYPPEVVESCQATLGDQCATVRCGATRPRSFTVERGSDGLCAFADECTTAGECALAANWYDECACVGTWPRALVDGDACLVELGEEPAQDCPGGPDLLCLCAVPTTPACVEDGELHVCR